MNIIGFETMDNPSDIIEETKRLYADIIQLPHPVSRVHPPMPMSNRAAQFAPFAALTGYDVAIEDTSHQVMQQVDAGLYDVLPELAENMVDPIE